MTIPNNITIFILALAAFVLSVIVYIATENIEITRQAAQREREALACRAENQNLKQQAIKCQKGGNHD